MTYIGYTESLIPYVPSSAPWDGACRTNNVVWHRLQGGGKRKGAFAIYLEPWHSDIFDWLDLRKNHGKEENRCRDLFYGLWVNDLFMQVRPPHSPPCPWHRCWGGCRAAPAEGRS